MIIIVVGKKALATVRKLVAKDGTYKAGRVDSDTFATIYDWIGTDQLHTYMQSGTVHVSDDLKVWHISTFYGRIKK